MSYEVTIDGIPVRCATPAEVVGLIKHAKQELTTGITKRRPGRPPNPNGEIERERKLTVKRESVLTFLKTIAQAGDAGITSESLVKALGIKSMKAIGGVTVVVNRLLGKSDLEQSSVYTTLKTEDGKQWLSRRRISDAIQALETAEIAFFVTNRKGGRS
jgi:DNA-binding protein